MPDQATHESGHHVTVCLFIALEIFQTNASNVNAMKRMAQSMRFGSKSPFREMKPATPATTKHAQFFTLRSGASGVFCFTRPRIQISNSNEDD